MDKRNKGVRANIVGQVTRLEKFYTENHETASEIELQLRVERLTQLFQSFNKVQEEIELNDNGDMQMETEEQHRSQFEDKYFSIRSKYEAKIKAKNVTVVQQLPAENIANIVNNNNVARPVQEHQNRLPPIALPKFDGQVCNWYSFQDTFKSLIHSDPNLDTIRKFHYLKSCLVGEASNIIQSIPVIGNNYLDAWNLITERYNNKKLLINFHLKGLIEQPSIKNENHIDLHNLIDISNKHVRALNSLEIPVNQWDVILIYIITNKLDPESKRQWDMTLKNDVLPTFKELEEFIQKRCFVLSNMSGSTIHNIKNSKSNKVTAHVSSSENSNIRSCNICKSFEHKTFRCPNLIKLSAKERFQLIKKKNLCLKCFGTNHSLSECKFFNCKTCNQCHNNLLHFNNEDRQSSIPAIENNEQVITYSTKSSNTTSVLATALVRIKDSQGQYHIGRALLDPGSTSNCITRKFAEKLNLKLSKSNIKITGVESTSSKVLFVTECSISSPIKSFSQDYNFLVLKNVTTLLPNNPIDTKNWTFLENYSLADPTFSTPGKIDLLLGVEIYEDIVSNDVFKPSMNLPTLRDTVFGWVVTGKISMNINEIDGIRNTVSLHIINDLADDLKKFWEIEEVFENNPKDESFCETHFKENFERLNSGRIQVKLPFDPSMSSFQLGESRSMALKLLLQMERKRNANPVFNQGYIKFMREYETLNHMELVPENEIEIDTKNSFYLPHHAVLKETSATTKLRVVFNGSAKSSTGKSLNDLLALGPKIQDNLFDLLCRFRTYPFVLTADIEKMYRQVLISPEHRDFSRILWRYSTDEKIQTFRLNTVTYGTKSASFLAIRALQQVAIENKTRFPTASRAILNDFYVDNLATGSFSYENTQNLLEEINKITSSGGFPLRQWCSNQPELIKHLPESSLEQVSFLENSEDGIHMLGINWSPKPDILCFSYTPFSMEYTKRAILSNISKIFDPLGLLSPIIIRSKIFLQNLWLKKLDWDQELDEESKINWKTIREDLSHIPNIKIPRYLSENPKINQYMLHTFCDASTAAYAAAVYLVSVDQNKQTFSNLLCSKTKVAPLKPITIPRLELCGAVLSAKLVNHIVKCLPIKLDKIIFWSDSQITLHWIRSPARDWKTFVSNRVSLIHENLEALPYSWQYVPTKENPADLASRGFKSEDLRTSKIWWHGPNWLTLPDSYWPKSSMFDKIDTKIERKNERIVLLATHNINDNYLINRFSSFLKLIRVIVQCLRFVKKLRGEPCNNYMSANEYKRALVFLVKMHQIRNFPTEIERLNNKRAISLKSNILNLNPFTDQNGIMRVGGRIQNSNLSFSKKHPILLNKNDQLTNIIIDHYHLKYFHASCRMLKSILLQNFWIIGSTSAIKKRIYNCVVCIRLRASTAQQIMGNLPSDRIIPSRPFKKCGVDYAGPILTKRSRGRCNSFEKSYIALFICFTTRAIHLELVSDLTVEGFIAALKRFIGRRGRPSDIFSDNGSNFVGTKNSFEELKNTLNSPDLKTKLYNFSSSEFINWHFIPAYTPQMGGLWEAGVKSVKIV